MNRTTLALALGAALTLTDATAQSRSIADAVAPLTVVDRSANAIGVDFSGTALLRRSTGQLVTASFCGSDTAGWQLGCSALVYFDAQCRGTPWATTPTRATAPGLAVTPVVQRADGVYVYETVGNTPGVSTFQYVESFNPETGTRTCDVNEDYVFIWPLRLGTKLALLPPYSAR